jgi:hypothetical protein
LRGLRSVIDHFSILYNSAKFCAMQKKQQFAFSAINFYLLAVAIVTVLIGFVLMSGKGSTDTQFNPTIFDNTRTVVAPIICFLGYLFMIVAILYRPKAKNEAENPQQAQTTNDTQAEVVVTLETDAPLQTTSCATTSAEA